MGTGLERVQTNANLTNLRNYAMFIIMITIITSMANVTDYL